MGLTENYAYIPAAVLIGIVAVLLLIRRVIRIGDFKNKLDYINMEIGRTEGREQKRWKKEKIKHWLLLIPFCFR